MRRVRIRLLWHKQAQFAGYLVAERLGLAGGAGVEIVCEGLDFSSKHVESVLSGAAEMCVASPAHVLESRAPERLAWLVAIQQESPLVYPVRRTSGIERLADLAGRSVGVWPGHEDLELRWMLAGEGVPADSVRRIEMPETVGPFLSGDIDCAQMTTYHELHEVERALGPDAIRIFSGAATGRGLLKDGLVTSRAFVAEHPGVVQAVVDAVLEGWTVAFTDAEAAVAACAAARPDVPAEEHRAQLSDIRALSLRGATATEGLGFPDPVHLERAARAIREVEGRAVGIAGVLDRGFYDRAPPRVRPRMRA